MMPQRGFHGNGGNGNGNQFYEGGMRWKKYKKMHDLYYVLGLRNIIYIIYWNNKVIKLTQALVYANFLQIYSFSSIDLLFSM